MKCFFVDTSSHYVNLAIIENNEVIDFYSEKNDNKLSERIFNLIEKFFSINNLKVHDLDKIFIATGPGSFTGIRVGLTIAKTMAWALKIPLIPVSTLELLASTNIDGDYIVPIINDRNDFVYAGIYDDNLNCIMVDSYIQFDKLKEETLKYNNITFISYDLIYKTIKAPKIDIIKVIKKHENDEIINVHHVNPNYIKKIEAEMNLENDKRNN